MSEQWMSTLGQGPHWSDWSETHTHCPSRTTRRDIEPLDHITWRQPTTGCSLVARLLSTGCKHIGCQQMTLAVWMGYSTHSRVPPPKRRKRQPTRSLAPGTSEGGSRPAVTSASRSCVYLSSERCMLPNDKDACYPVQAHSSSFQLIPAHSGSFRLIPARSNHCTGFRDKPLRLMDPGWILKRCEGPKFWSLLVRDP